MFVIENLKNFFFVSSVINGNNCDEKCSKIGMHKTKFDNYRIQKQKTKKTIEYIF